MSMQESSVFTHSERTELKYTVRDAVASARRRLNADGMKDMCVNALSWPRRLSYDDKITLEKLNEISDSLYHDSHYYYNGPPLRKPKPQNLRW